MLQVCSLKKTKTVWDDYYGHTILGDAYLAAKTALVQDFVSDISFNSLVDLGANDGHFSLLFKNTGRQVIAVDGDVNCVDALYKKIKQDKIKNILPLVISLTAPSPSIGFNNAERNSFTERSSGDMVFALALVHHLAIGSNLPLHFIAQWLAPMGEYLLIEFVPKEDEKVQLLLQYRADIFTDYTLKDFEIVFGEYYNILKKQTVGNTQRILFLLQRR